MSNASSDLAKYYQLSYLLTLTRKIDHLIDSDPFAARK